MYEFFVNVSALFYTKLHNIFLPLLCIDQKNNTPTAFVTVGDGCIKEFLRVPQDLHL